MSKGLEALKDLRLNVSTADGLDYEENNYLCDVIEKELKVLEILKGKIILNESRSYPASGITKLSVSLDINKEEVENMQEKDFNLIKEAFKDK